MVSAADTGVAVAEVVALAVMMAAVEKAAGVRALLLCLALAEHHPPQRQDIDSRGVAETTPR